MFVGSKILTETFFFLLGEAEKFTHVAATYGFHQEYEISHIIQNSC